MAALVYKLICPIKKEPIYVGSTSKSIESRLSVHISSIRKNPLPLYSYLRKNKIIPTAEILEKTSKSELKMAEKKWVEKLMLDGFRLLNVKIIKKTDSGSVKVDPQIYREVADFCETKGLKITFFATEAISEKLEKEKLKSSSNNK